VLFGLTVSVNEITESHPLAPVTTRLYRPADVKFNEPKLYPWPWHIQALVDELPPDTTAKLSVITESQPFAATKMRV
jgi:hypothetical protein